MTPFDGLAERYDRWYEKPFGKGAYRLELECLSSLVEHEGLSLEVGVGTGRFAEKLKVDYGLDPSLPMLKLAKKRGIKVVRGVGEALPFKGEVFGGVFIVVSLCFVRDPRKVLEESRRVLKRGGKLYLGLILRESRWADFYLKKAREGHPVYRHARFYSFFELKELLKDLFVFEKMKSTLIEEPQDKRPPAGGEVREGFYELAGFTCLRLEKR